MFGGLKKYATADNLYLLGAGLKDASGGGSENLMGAQQLMAKRQASQQQQELAQRAAGLFGGGRSLQDPGAREELMQLVAQGFDPSGMAAASKIGAPDLQVLQYGRGAYDVYDKANDKIVRSQAATPEAPIAPSGMEVVDGRLQWRPGYVDSVGQLTGIKREAVTSRPMPSRARGGGGKLAGGAAKLPSGFILD